MRATCLLILALAAAGAETPAAPGQATVPPPATASLPGESDAAYKERAAAATTAAAHEQLAGWCKDRGWNELAARHAIKAIELDGNLQGPRTLLTGLGYEQFDGAWLAKADAAKRKIERERALQAAAAAVTTAQVQMETHGRSVGNYKRRLAELERGQKQAETNIATCEKGVQALADALKKRDAANDAMEKTRREGYDAQGRRTVSYDPGAQRAAEEAQRQYVQAKRSYLGWDQSLPQLKQALADNLREQEQVKQRIAALEKQVADAKAALEKAQEEQNKLISAAGGRAGSRLTGGNAP